MKKILIIILCIISTVAQSQIFNSRERLQNRQYKQLRNELINNSPIIFEGACVQKEVFRGTDGNYYEAEHVEISKILRGANKINYGSIEVIHPYYYNLINVADSMRGRMGEPTGLFKGMYFCEELNQEFPVSKQYIPTNKIRVKPTHGEASFLDYYAGYLTNINKKEQLYGLYNKKFKSIDAFYEFLKSYDNMSLPSNDDSSYVEKERKDFKTSFPVKQSKLKSARDSSSADKYWGRRLKETNWGRNVKKKNNLKSTMVTSASIGYSVENPRMISGANDVYLAVDIKATSSNSGVFHDLSAVWLQLDDCFNINPGDESKIIVTNGSQFSNYNILPNIDSKNMLAISQYADFQIDENNNVIRYPNRTTINGSAVLFTVQIPIDKTSNVWLIFDRKTTIIFNTAIQFSFYNSTYNGLNDGFQYDAINYTQPSSMVICPTPVITSFSESESVAGDGRVLTINGRNFGNGRGLGSVSFTDANTGGNKEFSIDAIDFHVGENVSGQTIGEYWTPTEIKIKIPSYNFQGKYCSGSGDVTINTAWKKSDSKAIKIKTAYYNVPDVTEKSQYFLTNMGGGSGIKFRLASAFPPDAEAAIRKAFNDLSAYFSIYFEITTDASCPNIITIDESITTKVPNALMLTTISNIVTNSTLIGNSARRAYATNLNIGIRFSGVSWGYTQPVSSSQQDFYQAFVHELGHTLSLDHINDVSQIMNYADVGNLKLTSSGEHIVSDALGIIDLSKQITWGALNITLTDKSTAVAPAQPTSLSASSYYNNKADLTWSDNSNNETGFEIEVFDKTNYSTVSVSTPANTSSYTVTNLLASRTYTFRVRAVNNGLYSLWSNDADATTLATNNTTSPVQATWASVPAYTGSGVYMSWSGNSIDKYVIQRAVGSSSTYSNIATVGPNVFDFSDASIQANSSYKYRIVSVNNMGNATSSVNTVTLSSLDPCVDAALVIKYQSLSHLPLYSFARSNVFIGSAVDNTKPQGAVIVQPDESVIVESGLNIDFEAGVEIAPNQGISFEARIVPCATSSLKSANTFTTVQSISNSEINLFPNPVNDLLNIQFNENEETTNNVILYNLTGAKLFETGRFKMDRGVKQIDVSNLKAGIYLINIYSNGKVSNHKIVVN